MNYRRKFLISDERILRGERKKSCRRPEGKFISGTRAKLVPREQKGDRKNQENGKCIRRRVGKLRNKRSERKFENFSSRASPFALSFASTDSILPLDYRGN